MSQYRGGTSHRRQSDGDKLWMCLEGRLFYKLVWQVRSYNEEAIVYLMLKEQYVGSATKSL